MSKFSLLFYKRNFHSFLLIICIFLSFVFSSCNNFLNGSDFLEELNNSITYQNLTYADITVVSLTSATESIFPAVGNYNDKYKISDSIKLDFTATSKYQFIKWIATPENSIEFENEKSLSTIATILNSDEKITIQPLVYERADISISPSNNNENPKNSSIIISSSIPLTLNDEILKDIQIKVDDFVINDKYDVQINNEKTEIAFIPKRDKFIDVPAGSTKIVKVSIPDNLYYEKNGEKIYIGSDIVHTFLINSKTKTSVEITVNSSTSKGDLSYSGTKTYYLDDEFSVSVTPNKAYIVKSWDIKYADGNQEDVEKSVLHVEVDTTTIYVKVLTGTSRSITISPHYEERGFITVKFYAENGNITPTEEKIYYVGENFSVSYKEVGAFSFTGWQVIAEDDSLNEDEYISFESIHDLDTKCYVKKGGATLTVVATSSDRPSITGFFPETMENINRDTSIKVLFSQSMSETSIYWTKEELNSLGITEGKYDLFLAEGLGETFPVPYYYAYQEKNKPKTLTYKNIEIVNRTTGESLLQYFNEPCFETKQNITLLILSKGGEGDVLPSNTQVDVRIGANFVNKKLIPVNQNLVKTFIINNELTNNPPVLNVSNIKIDGLNKSGTAVFEYKTNTESEIVSNDDFSKCFTNDISELGVGKWNQLTKVIQNENSKISVTVKGFIISEANKPAFLQVSLVPIETELNQVMETYSKKIKLTYNSIGKTDFSENGLTFDFDLYNKVCEGVYKVKITAIDKKGKELDFNKVYPFYYDDGKNPMVNVANLIYPWTEENIKREPLEITAIGKNYFPSKEKIENITYVKESDENNLENLIFSFNEVPNYEYCIYSDEVSENERKWISTKLQYNLTEQYGENKWWIPKCNKDNWKKELKFSVRDTLQNTTDLSSLFLLYLDEPIVNSTEIVEHDKDKSELKIRIDIQERSSGLSKIKMNNLNTGEKITDSEGNNLNYTVNNVGNFLVLNNPIYPDENGIITLYLHKKYQKNNGKKVENNIDVTITLNDINNFQSEKQIKYVPCNIEHVIIYEHKEEYETYFYPAGATTDIIPKDSKDYEGFEAEPFDQVKNLQSPKTITIKYVKITNIICYKTPDGNDFDGVSIGIHNYGEETPLKIPEDKNNYYFEGWYWDSECKGSKIDKIGAKDINHSGEVYVYGKWIYGAKVNLSNDGLKNTLKKVDFDNSPELFKLCLYSEEDSDNVNYYLERLDNPLKDYKNEKFELDLSNLNITNLVKVGFTSISNVEKIILPEGLTTLSNDSLRHFTSLTDIVLPESLSTIGEHNFTDMENLKKVIIPRKVTKIEKYNFFGMTNLEEVVFEDSENWYRYTEDAPSDKTPISFKTPGNNAIILKDSNNFSYDYIYIKEIN